MQLTPQLPGRSFLVKLIMTLKLSNIFILSSITYHNNYVAYSFPVDILEAESVYPLIVAGGILIQKIMIGMVDRSILIPLSIWKISLVSMSILILKGDMFSIVASNKNYYYTSFTRKHHNSFNWTHISNGIKYFLENTFDVVRSFLPLEEDSGNRYLEYYLLFCICTRLDTLIVMG